MIPCSHHGLHKSTTHPCPVPRWDAVVATLGPHTGFRPLLSAREGARMCKDSSCTWSLACLYYITFNFPLKLNASLLSLSFTALKQTGGPGCAYSGEVEHGPSSPTSGFFIFTHRGSGAPTVVPLLPHERH